MPAKPGVVSSFDGKTFGTVDDAPALGISGSGATDLLAELVKSGAVTRGGELLPPDETPAFSERISIRNGEACFDIAEGVFLSASDVRKLQLAKAAIRAALSLLLKKSGTRLSDIDAFFLAGAFGTALSAKSAETIGLIPHELLSVCTSVGNSALRGAVLALFSEDAKAKLCALRDKAIVVELSGDSEFEEEFLKFIPM